jgi:gliding motility-associated-like protein
MKQFYCLLFFVFLSHLLVAQDCSGISGDISPANSTICEGSSVVLTATGGSSYEWRYNNELIENETGSTITVSKAGTYSVIIKEDECSVPASNIATVDVTPTPAGTISPASSAICQGSSVKLTATGGSSYTWFRNGTEIFGENNETIETNLPGTYSVIIRQGDCSGEASNTAEVSLLPVPTGNISPALASICFGSAVELSATGGTSYTWYLNGFEIQGETGATINASQAGIYSVTIHQGDCSGSASNVSIVTLTPAPIGNISPAADNICEGESVTLTATGGTSYIWFRNGDEISGETQSTLNVTDDGTYFAIIRQDKCSGPAMNSSIITKSPMPSGTISPESGTICTNGSMELKATGGTSYTWFRDGEEIRGRRDAEITVRQPGTYTVTIHQGNCSAPASNSVVISQASIPTGTITPSTASFCEGGSALLTASGGSSYLWYRNGSLIQGETSATLNAVKPGTYTVTVKQGDCSGPASNSAVVNVTTTPSGGISPASATICGNGSVVLTATGGTSYTWLRDDEVIEGEQSANLTATQAGIYSVIIRNGTCEGAGSNSASVAVEGGEGKQYPAINTIAGKTVELEARNIGESYEWTPSIGLSNSTSRTPYLIASSDTEYIVKITTKGGCIINDTVAIRLNTSIFVPTGFTPNSNGKNDQLRPMGALKSIEAFKVFNRWGQLMYQSTDLKAGWDGRFKGALQPADAYMWYLIATGADGKPIKLSGKTYLIR